MNSDDYERFVEVLQSLGVVYAAKLTDEQVKFYWNALKDRDLADIERRADVYGRTGRFFPKPRDLRPNEGAKEVIEESAEARQRFESMNREVERGWNDRLAADPLRTKLLLCAALEARYSVEPDQGNVFLAEKRDELRSRREALIREAVESGRPELVLTDLTLWKDCLTSPKGPRVIDRLEDLCVQKCISSVLQFLGRAKLHRLGQVAESARAA